jgi:HrpA-like RNA helicase
LPELRRSVSVIVNKDLSSLDEIIEKKYDEILEEGQKDSTSNKYKKLAEEHEDLTENKENFVETRDEVVMKIENNKEDKNLMKVCLKKLIIAEKQLESKLPIVTKKRKIFEMLKMQNLLIIEGETGSGKSTQLPQMLCEYYNLFDSRSSKPVLVTQPRRLATRTLAERVAKEMGEEVGGFVDYVASAGKKVSSAARIIFKLDRLVLD